MSHPIWGGFGVIANYTFSDAKSQSGDPIPGNSKHSLQRDRLLRERPDLGARCPTPTGRNSSSTSIAPRRSTRTRRQSLDASASYKLTDNVSLTADAMNLTNEKIVQYLRQARFRPRAIYDNGRQFYFGARFRY